MPVSPQKNWFSKWYLAQACPELDWIQGPRGRCQHEVWAAGQVQGALHRLSRQLCPRVGHHRPQRTRTVRLSLEPIFITIQLWPFSDKTSLDELIPCSSRNSIRVISYGYDCGIFLTQSRPRLTSSSVALFETHRYITILAMHWLSWSRCFFHCCKMTYWYQGSIWGTFSMFARLHTKNLMSSLTKQRIPLLSPLANFKKRRKGRQPGDEVWEILSVGNCFLMYFWQFKKKWLLSHSGEIAHRLSHGQAIYSGSTAAIWNLQVRLPAPLSLNLQRQARWLDWLHSLSPLSPMCQLRLCGAPLPRSAASTAPRHWPAPPWAAVPSPSAARQAFSGCSATWVGAVQEAGAILVEQCKHAYNSTKWKGTACLTAPEICLNLCQRGSSDAQVGGQATWGSKCVWHSGFSFQVASEVLVTKITIQWTLCSQVGASCSLKRL